MCKEIEFIKTDNRKWFTRGWEREERRDKVKGYSISIMS
jgi:hypothetical protein